MTERVRIGVIGGSGVYQIEALTDVEEIVLETPFGSPSDAYLVGTLAGQRVAFLARHGRGHRFSPSRVNYRANIYGFKMLGVEYLIGVSACGSLREDIAPGHIVIPDQLFDRTRGRKLSFFDDPDVGTDGLVVHVGVADPFCPMLSRICYEAVKETGALVHWGGNFVTVEGPRFSTKAESRVFRSWGMDIIGMTTTPEAQLAREAEMSYAVMAHVTDYDVWHESETPVTVEMVVRTLMSNAEIAKRAVVNAIRRLEGAGPSPQAAALRDAIITNRAVIRADVIERLSLLIGKYIPGSQATG
ncbi:MULTISPECIES: S-methyl-5'-thioadenosine phosphorylase [Caldilinea]|uniref:S-methyl-5'-thioadenosine phosphorylase n=1 Tax=Caldilinea aerophila (strain DSM 14535 / JCM 11387 / NBRC 104270 / STL-6-O1) TaxID=926550 RepID=I0I972_CALAS|nr:MULTISPECIES: S-methyl-5'-thioadenosine phosphorylase [Caldilinea]BAM01810.1 S-methyl-5-thioadenosine phosphorylase [Caldilinea aerophila DSM 14535 = NBRC 104270]GIV73144.1 MAG: S-methyl-5'-thioadenosine phosphorylase [Caldilinea sp.]